MCIEKFTELTNYPDCKLTVIFSEANKVAYLANTSNIVLSEALSEAIESTDYTLKTVSEFNPRNLCKSNFPWTFEISDADKTVYNSLPDKNFCEIKKHTSKFSFLNGVAYSDSNKIYKEKFLKVKVINSIKIIDNNENIDLHNLEGLVNLTEYNNNTENINVDIIGRVYNVLKKDLKLLSYPNLVEDRFFNQEYDDICGVVLKDSTPRVNMILELEA